MTLVWVAFVLIFSMVQLCTTEFEYDVYGRKTTLKDNLSLNPNRCHRLLITFWCDKLIMFCKVRQKVDNCLWQLLLTRPQSYLLPFIHCTVFILTHNNFTIFLSIFFFIWEISKLSQSKFRQNIMLKNFPRKTQKLFLWKFKF